MSQGLWLSRRQREYRRLKPGKARGLTKGGASLGSAGKGDGVDVSIAISDFKISKPAL
ncbi:hypothetical protein [Ralstonia wenshanensis]|uniref:hypothetical protein n=1 Tax=Ralstonia wenshanensis TaxID=2842456 RepID=UPI0039C60886